MPHSLQGRVGPDIALVGAARSGTSFLADKLGKHPDIDPGDVKEPNYFSREIDRGDQWYDGLYRSRREGRHRLDASVSYTFAHFPAALERLAQASPEVYVVYAVRDPLRRLVSHYQLHRDYFRNESAATLGEALTFDDVFSGASDYARWLTTLTATFPPDRLLVVPFSVITANADEVLGEVAAACGLDQAGFDHESPRGVDHRNAVVEFRSPLVRRVWKAVRRAGLYPMIRGAIGPDRLRFIRGKVTQPVQRESAREALATCSPDQVERLHDLATRGIAQVSAVLAEQDQRLGLAWGRAWAHETSEPVAL